jgi:hypothetical protein
MPHETEMQLPRRLSCCVDTVKTSSVLLNIINVDKLRLLDRNVVKFVENSRYRRNISPLSSGSKSKLSRKLGKAGGKQKMEEYVLPKRRGFSTPNGVTTRKTILFIVTAVRN